MSAHNPHIQYESKYMKHTRKKKNFSCLRVIFLFFPIFSIQAVISLFFFVFLRYSCPAIPLMYWAEHCLYFVSEASFQLSKKKKSEETVRARQSYETTYTHEYCGSCVKPRKKRQAQKKAFAETSNRWTLTMWITVCKVFKNGNTYKAHRVDETAKKNHWW